MSATLVVLLIVLVAAVLFCAIRSNPSRQSRRAAAEVSSILNRAEIMVQSGDLSVAEAMYIRALADSEEAGDKLLCAECYYGLARVEQKRLDFETAARMLEFALSTSHAWRNEKPNFELLLQRELQRMQEKQNL